MVFGNMGDDCATGVAFTRNPSTGENVFYGEYLVNAQGEDVVAGIRTPQPLSQGSGAKPDETPHGRGDARRPTRELLQVRETLEKHYRDMQDIEFTVQQRQALHAADPQRQAHRRGGAAASRSTWRARG